MLCVPQIQYKKRVESMRNSIVATRSKKIVHFIKTLKTKHNTPDSKERQFKLHASVKRKKLEIDKLFSNISSRSSCEIKKRKRECDHDYSYYENSSQPLTASEHQILSCNSDSPSSPTTQETMRTS